MDRQSYGKSLVEDYRVESFVSGHGFSRAEQRQLGNKVSAKARLVALWLKLESWGGVAARLKPCPDTKQNLSPPDKLGDLAT
jgi:hypothetical protein